MSPRDDTTSVSNPHGPEHYEVILRHARLIITKAWPNGRPMYCKPSHLERTGEAARKQGAGTDGKVIYPDRNAAEAAAREFERLYGRPLRTFECRRSRYGHYLLSTDKPALRRLSQ